MQAAIAESLALHFEWLKELVDLRIRTYFEQLEPGETMRMPMMPDLMPVSPLDEFFQANEFSWQERAILLLALCPYVRPELLDILFTENTNFKRGFTEFGGVKGKTHGGFLPTGETVVFILAGNHVGHRLEAMRLLHPEHLLFREGVIERMSVERNEPPLSAQLTVSKAYRRRFLWNEMYEPDFGPEFPARRLTTKLEWEDLVLPDYVLDQVLEIKTWLEYKRQINDGWRLEQWLKPGYRCLFYGPPGTGKTLTASLLGKELRRSVFRVDLSMVVSKYIGETEKNLASIFDQAEHKSWILFFDEADSLFGKRTETHSAHDRYANQEVSYLLQRIESYNGLVILASNFKGNVDAAFQRRFQSMVYFPLPDAQSRLELWSKVFSGPLRPEPSISLEQIAEKYELSGGEIVNVLQSVAIQAARNGTEQVFLRDLLNGIRKEFRKNGRVV